MKHIILLALCLILCITPLFAVAETVDLSDMSQEELLALINAAQLQLDLSEPQMIEKAIQAVKDAWTEQFNTISFSSSESGYLKIVNTRVIYIKEKLSAREGIEK